MTDQPQASYSWRELPNEIWLIIFRAIPDIPSLRALTHTNSTLHKIFINNASSVSFAVLSNEIPASIFPEAIAAWSSLTIKPWNKARVRAFLHHYHANREAQLNQSWTLYKASKVSKLHQRCRFFASEFFASLPSTNPVSGSAMLAFAPSLLEVNRLEQAFHRFEMYCNLFRRPFLLSNEERFTAAEQRDIYFNHYTAWENEQLACIHDYLFCRLSDSFNDLALRDAERGASRIDIIFDNVVLRNGWKEGVLSLGLAFLQDLFAAQTYEQRRQLLGSGMIPGVHFLSEGLWYRRFCTDMLLEQLSTVGKTGLVNKPFFPVDDVGPYEAWKWAYTHSDVNAFFHNDRYYLSRTWGFCLWDHARLISWGILNMP